MGACNGDLKSTENSGESAPNLIDKELTLHVLDSIGYVLNRPTVPEGFNVYYDCDSVVFMKRIIGDTIEIYQKGGYTPLYYSSTSKFDSFEHYIENYDPTDFTYLSKFYKDGRIILENPTHHILIVKNDSLFNYYADDFQYIDQAIDLDLKVMYDEITPHEANKKKQELRAQYSPVEKLDFIFHKDLFRHSKKVKLDSSMNDAYSYVTLKAQWVYEEKQCYSILLSDSTAENIRKSAYVFNEDFEFIEDENCIVKH